MFEEAVSAGPRDLGAAFAFAVARVAEEARPLMIVATRWWLVQHGRPFARGLGLPERAVLLVRAKKEAEALWAMEQGLRSGALGGVIGAIEEVSLTQTRRIDFAAREGGSTAIMLRTKEGGLSAARLRWRIAAAASAPDPFDPEAPGAPRIMAELLRRRDGPPGRWLLEADDATGRLHLADRLAGHGPRQDEPRTAA
jgi:protein ImuA